MAYRFFIIVRGSDPTIYKVPVCQTARLINEYPNQKFQIYESLPDAEQAALKIASRFTQLPAQPANENARTATSKLTEDGVERFQF